MEDDRVENTLQELTARLHEINDLEAAASVLSWDQTTYMPPGGAPARGRQLATLQRLAHEQLIDPAIGRLLDELRPYEERLPYDSDAAALIRVTRREYELASKLPPSFVAELSSHSAAAYQAWTTARAANDFATMQPYLEKMVELSRQRANFYPGYEHIADPLIADLDYGMKTSEVRSIFAELRAQLVPIVQAITAQQPASDACLHQNFPEAQQVAFGLEVIKRFGYDLQRGRQDKTWHPYMTKFSFGDVRITTRFDEHDLSGGLFSTLHEAGHALYEQGVRADLDRTPLSYGTSSAVHESQSRLWENLVGRSQGMWQFFYPQLQATFPEQLGSVEFDSFYRAINKVDRSLIRTESDEVTYNLHVIIRFDLELDLLEGRLAVRDLPEAWRERYRSDLGLIPPDDRDGVMQDMHWYAIQIGGVFQGYTLGNILSAQFYDAAVRAHPQIPDEIKQGEFDTLRGWLREQIYQHGSKFTPTELIQRVTGGALTIEPYIRYLRTKYGELYAL
jgi:carboxypeptidase Taq